MAVNAQTYFAANPDVASSYAQNSYGMTPDAFAEFHFKNFGAAESRGGSGVTSLQILDYLKATPGLSDAQIVSSMKTYGISPSQMAQAIGIPEGQIVSRIAATLPPNQAILLGDTYVQAVNQITGSGEDQQVGGLENVITYKASENKPGGNINYYSPTGEYQQTTQQQAVDTSLGGALKDIVSNPGFKIIAAAYGLNAALGAFGATAAGTAAGTGLGASTSLGTGLTAGAGGLGLSTTGAGLGALGTGAGITAGTGLGTGVLAGSSLGTGLLGAGALTGAATLGGTTLGATGTGLGASGLGAGSSLGTGITAGTSGLGLTTTGAGLGATGTGAGITAGTGLTGTGVLTGSGLGSTLLGTGAGALTGTGVLTGSGLGTSLLGTGTGTGVTGGVTGLGTGTLGTGALTTGVGTGVGTTLSGVGTGVGAGTAAGTGLGGLTASQLGSLLSGALTTGSGILQQQTSAAAAQRAQQMIDAETAAAKQAAAFRPIGMTTRFGTSEFVRDPITGQLTSAKYTLSPEAKAQQDRLNTLAGAGLTQAEGAQEKFKPLQTGAESLFKLGAGYLAEKPEDVAKNYLASQLALLKPGRDLELANLQNRLQQQGRGGLSVAQGGTMGATTPELQALYNARAQQEAVLAAQAQQAGQQQVAFGAGLLGTGAQTMGQYYGGQQAAYAPYTTALGQVTGLEALGQQPFGMSTALAQQAAQAGANVGRLGLSGAEFSTRLATGNAATTNPYSTLLSGLGASPAFGQAIGGLFS
jgi:hypothetical protein